MSDSGLEDIIIDLKILSLLNQNNKLVTGGSYLNVEQPNLIPEFFKRWMRGDSRDEAVKRINTTISAAIDKIKDTSDNNIVLMLSQHLKNAIKGLENLKRTYSKCRQTVARLDSIIEKVKTTILVTITPPPLLKPKNI